MNYKYLVCAALSEELIGFYKASNVPHNYVGHDLDEVNLDYNGRKIPVATYSANKMGMPYNSAKLMQVILEVNPKFVLFIGTCAGLKEYPIGTVLVPHKVFTYESGKFDRDGFSPDYASFDTSNRLRKEADILRDKLNGHASFKVVTDDDFCSGAAIIDDEKRAKEIKENGARKLSGLDMEAYSIACIDNILNGRNELLVIKAISDFAFNKTVGEKEGNKDLAILNSALFAHELIKSIEERGVGNEHSHSYLDISTSPNYGGTVHPVKVWFTIKNNSRKDMAIRSDEIILNSPFQIAPKVGMFNKPMFKVGSKEDFEKKCIDNFKDVCILKPGESVESCWIPLHPDTNRENLTSASEKKLIGRWKYKTWVLYEESIQCENVLLV
jgi:nucleoside phosphorylase